VESSLSERPEHHRPRRLADWINPAAARKVHSLIDKVYKRKNLEIAWERVKANQGAGGVDGESIEAFGEQREERLEQLHEELRTDSYIPQPVRRAHIPKAGKPGAHRTLGIPSIYDRVCQQALRNRLEPIFEPVFDDANFGYRSGRSTNESSSTGLTAGSCGASGRIDSGAGAAADGGNCHRRSSTASCDLSTLLGSFLPLPLSRERLRESWMRENCTSSLCGGRRPARGEPSAPPPTRH